MKQGIYSSLSWLPAPPADFNERCRLLLSDSGAKDSGAKDSSSKEEQYGSRLRALANTRLDEVQLLRLSKTIGTLRARSADLRPLDEVKLGLLCNGTSDFLVPTIAGSALRHGVAAEIVRGDYGQSLQEALSPESAVNSRGVQVVLVALDYRAFPFHVCTGDLPQAESVIQTCMGYLQAIRSGIKTHAGAVCILQTLAPPVEELFGSLDRALPGSLRWLIESFNDELAKSVLGSDDILFDVAGLASIVGLEEWHSPMAWNMAKMPFGHSFLPIYGDHVGRLLGSLRGKSRRCLILDLDNTVWGGVIGDDGLEGIQIAQGDAIGEAHLDIQRIALALRGRGILLAVSSKNTDEVARRPFLDHPEMLLKLDHIAVFQANWRDKATNIQAIAEELSLGLESMVFLDDNPMERDLVRQMLPAVAVPELPADPALYARTLIAGGYFESVRFSAEDVQRAEFYQNNSRRAELQQQAGDLDAYLASLEMKVTFQPFDDVGRARIAQLIGKSNQFNLTTRRYSEADVAALQNDPQAFTMQVRLSDTFGDNGMISVIVCRHAAPGTLEIDTWLMSCRVLGRCVEHAVLEEIVQYARSQRQTRIVGRYLPTERNALVERHYAKLGFQLLETLADGTTVWEMKVAEAPCFEAPLSVSRVGFLTLAGQ